MEKRKLLRELNHLTSQLQISSNVTLFGGKFIDFKKETIERANTMLSYKNLPSSYVEQHKKYIRLFELSDILEISDDELCRRWKIARDKREEREVMMSIKPVKEGRDNKGVYVGNGGSNANKVRYPSKKRSLRTWKIFYEMFPNKAKQDNWDGKTSTKRP